MTVLLIGLVAVVGACWIARRPSQGRLSAFLWVLALSLLAIGQIWFQRDQFASYQLRLLGQRFHVAADDARSRTLSGDRATADLYVPGIGQEPIARLEVHRGLADGAQDSLELGDLGADTVISVILVPAEGMQGVVAARTDDGWEFLRSAPLEPGDRIVVSRGGREAQLEFRRSKLWLGRFRGPVDSIAVSSDASVATAAEIPYPDAPSLLGLFAKRPSVFRRSYPLADLAEAAGDSSSNFVGLSSFLYYDRDRGQARVMILDPGVQVLSQEGVSKEPVKSLPLSGEEIGGAGSPGPEIMVASLPYRDFRAPELTPPEHYGARPLMRFHTRVDGEWLTVARASPEVHAVVLETLPPDTRARREPEGDPLYLLRLSAGPVAGPSPGISLNSPSNLFVAPSQAILRLPESSTAGWFELLSPAGLAEWETGQPFTLGDGDRGLLLRVDGLGASGSFLLLLIGLFLLAAVPLAFTNTSGPVRGVAFAALGLVSVRLLLSLSAMTQSPFDEEGHQISLWLVPAVPWVLCVAGRRLHASMRVTRVAGLEWATLGVGGALVVFLAFTLFPGGIVKPGALTAVAIVVAGIGIGWWPEAGRWFREIAFLRRVIEAAWGAVRVVGNRVGGLVRWDSPAWWTGWAIGFAFFLARLLLNMMGFREQIPLGTRIGLSVLYTPLTVVFFALLVAKHSHQVVRVSQRFKPREVTWACFSIAGFLAFAYGATSLLISDIGIALTTMPGPLFVLAAAGWWWARQTGPAARFLGTLPIFLFVALQFAPSLVMPGSSGIAEQIEGTEDLSRNTLLLIERDDPEALQLIGESRSEALGVMRETLRSYTRGNWAGKGFLEGSVSPQIRTTATREHVVAGLLVSQWGLLGAAGLAAILAGVFWPVLPFRAHNQADRLALMRVKKAAPVRRRIVIISAVAAVVLVLLARLLPSPVNLVVFAVLVLGGCWMLWGRMNPPAWMESVVQSLWNNGSVHIARPGAGGDGPPAGSPGPLGSTLGGGVGQGRHDIWSDWWYLLAVTSLATFAAAGVYMFLANYGWVLFTGKNVFLLGLDSLGDTLESLALLGLGACAIARAGRTSWPPGTAAQPAEPSSDPGPAQ